MSVPHTVVTATENGQNIGGVPITLGYSGTGSPTGLGPVSTVSGVGATSAGLTVSAPAQGILSVNLPITVSGNSVQPIDAYRVCNADSPFDCADNRICGAFPADLWKCAHRANGQRRRFR